MYLAVKHFQHSLEGRQFVIYTDHCPLTFALHSKPDKYSPHETRHLDFVSQFTNDIQHISGEQNAAADVLSHLPINSLFSPSDIDLRQMALDQLRLDILDLSSPEFATCKFAEFATCQCPLRTRRSSVTPQQTHFDLLFR